MDKILEQLINNVNEAEGRLDYSETEFEHDINIDTLNKAKALENAYLNYKKAEAEFNEVLDARNKYYRIKTVMDSKRGL